MEEVSLLNDEERSTVDRALKSIDITLSGLALKERRRAWDALLKGGKNCTTQMVKHGTIAQMVTLEDLAMELSNLNIQQEFDKFFRQREDKKMNLYHNVVILGLGAGIIGATLNIFSGFGSSTYSMNPFNAFVFIVATILRVGGICLFSTVPVDDYDIFRQLTEPRNAHYKIILCLAGFINYGVVPIFDLFSKHYFNIWWLPFGLWMLGGFNPNISYDILSLKIIVAIALFGAQFLTGPLLVTVGLQRPKNEAYMPFYAQISQCVLWIIVVIFLFIFIVFGLFRRYKKHTSNHNGTTRERQLPSWLDSSKHTNWGAFELNVVVYALCIGSFFSFLINFIYLQVSSGNEVAASAFFIAAFGDLLPMLALVYFTPAKCFTFMARIFEGSMDQMQEDGALMAALIESCRDSSNNTVWLFRNNPIECGKMEDYKRFYVQGTGQIKGCCETILVDYKLDLETLKLGDNDIPPTFQQWTEKFFKSADKYYEDAKGDRDKEISNMSGANGDPSRLTIQQWTEKYFDIAEVFQKNDESEVVTIKRKIAAKVEDLSVRQMELLKEATGNLRVYKWKGEKEFLEEFLEKSPREMDSKNKEETYDKSEVLDVKSGTMIDFFISHSWNDDAEWKRRALIEFSNKFMEKNGRYPTFWFDKVCINQANPGDGIKALPVNIGACRGMLVLMGETYMTRLWCVWELFTLFTFSNKELALERITVLPHANVDVEEVVRNFHIDRATCFDPNEVVKLRYLMVTVIGVEKLVDSLKTLRLPEVSLKSISLSKSIMRALSLYWIYPDQPMDGPRIYRCMESGCNDDWDAKRKKCDRSCHEDV